MSGHGHDGAPPLSAEHLARVCAFLYQRTGIAYGEAKRYLIERRVADRLGRTGAGDMAAYLALLHGDGAEAEALINSFTINETYFYREDHQLRCLSRSLLPEIVARRGPGDLVRIWSVPCSTGEEPYSVAIWLLENWPLVDAYNIEIVGSDIDTRALAHAAVGFYGERALARLPAALRARYFGPAQGGLHQAIADLRESVRFTRCNLVDAASLSAQGSFDVVLCRNVLIYFDEAARLAAVRNLHERLTPGGFLCLGHAETTLRLPELFATRRFADAMVFQRPL